MEGISDGVGMPNILRSSKRPIDDNIGDDCTESEGISSCSGSNLYSGSNPGSGINGGTTS